ncbi:MAG: hypothetical protein AAGN66_02845 [Acidobacteriota bacterium]
MRDATIEGSGDESFGFGEMEALSDDELEGVSGGWTGDPDDPDNDPPPPPGTGG